MDGLYIVRLLVILAVILISMVLHELAHGLVAYWLGDNTAKEDGRLTLNPLKHLDPVMSFLLPVLMFITGGPIFGGAKPVPVNSHNLKHGAWGMVLVAIAGPITNFILALVFFLIGTWTGLLGPDASYYQNNIWSLIFAEAVVVNLGFGVFNLIPMPPLDGSRVLYAIAPDPVRDLMGWLEKYGIMILLLVIMLAPNFLPRLLGGAISGILTAFSWLVH